jgi:hypothetical protein
MKVRKVRSASRRLAPESTSVPDVAARPVLRLRKPLVRFGAEASGGTGRPRALAHGRPRGRGT